MINSKHNVRVKLLYGIAGKELFTCIAKAKPLHPLLFNTLFDASDSLAKLWPIHFENVIDGMMVSFEGIV